MKIRNVIRMNVIMIGIAAALFFASSGQAQEIENTAWSDGQVDAAVPQPGLTPNPATTQSNPGAPETPTLSASALVSGPNANQAAANSGWASLQLWLLASLLVGIAMAAIYALGEAKRASRDLAARLHASHPKATLF